MPPCKKDEDGTVKKTLYGAYAVVGKSLDDPDIPDPEMEGTTVGQKDKKGFVHFKKIKGYFFFINTIRKKIRSAWMVIHS